MTTMQDVTGVRPVVIPQEGAVLNHTHLLGIEVEMEGVGNANSCLRHMTLWTRKEDNSLRNSGCEFVLTNPLAGLQLETAIDQYYHAQSYASSASWDASHRCGIHVHSDVRDMTTQQYGRLLGLSILLDDYLFTFYNSSYRKGFNFCRPVENDNRTIMLSRRLSSESSHSEVVIGSPDRAKYMSINLCRVVDLGSLEYRHFTSTLTKPQMLRLCQDIQHLKSFAMLPTYAEALAAFKQRWPDVNTPKYLLKLLGVVA